MFQDHLNTLVGPIVYIVLKCLLEKQVHQAPLVYFVSFCTTWQKGHQRPRALKKH